MKIVINWQFKYLFRPQQKKPYIQFCVCLVFCKQLACKFKFKYWIKYNITNNRWIVEMIRSSSCMTFRYNTLNSCACFEHAFEYAFGMTCLVHISSSLYTTFCRAYALYMTQNEGKKICTQIMIFCWSAVHLTREKASISEAVRPPMCIKSRL